MRRNVQHKKPRRARAMTLRNLPPSIDRLIREKAVLEGTSVNRAAVKLLEEHLGAPQGERLHHDLDALAGSWREEEAEAFDQALTAQRRIDPELWK
jgi:hypothetical protein